MRAITFTSPRASGDHLTFTGHPTTVPGLIVRSAPDCQGDHDGEPWRVNHFRSGLGFPFCFTSPEAALAFAEHAARFGDWTVTGDALARRCALPYLIKSLTRRALDLGALVHGGPRDGDHTAVDNGVIA